MRKFIYILLMATLSLTACDRRDLEVMEPQKTHFRLIVDWADVDWMEYYGGMPSGMTVMLFGESQRRPIVELTNEVTSIELDLAPDRYKMVIFNNSTGEFGSMNFENMDNHDLMAARASLFTPMQATEWSKGTTFHREPEKIGTVLEEFEVTEDMLLSQVTFYPYKAWLRALRATTRFYQEDDLTYVLKVKVQPITSMLYVRVHVTGLVSMRSVEGSVSGLADGFYLTREHPTEDSALHLLDAWTTRSDANFEGSGWITAAIPVWGEPYGKEQAAGRPENHHELKLHFLLRDGKTEVDYTYNAGQMVRYIKQDDDGVWQYTDEVTPHLVLTIWDNDPGDRPYDPEDPNIPSGPPDPTKPQPEPNLPYVEGDGTGSGFDAEVADWEDGGTIDIGL